MRLRRPLVPLLLLLLVSAASCGSEDDDETGTGRTLHVEPGGDDEADGSVGAPWATLQTAVDRLEPGDELVVHEGTYPAPLSINVSGTPGAGRIVIRAAEGARPLLDGSTWEVGQGFSPLLGLHSVSHVRIEGFEIANASTDRAGHAPVGIFVSGSGSGVELVGNDIHDLATLATTGDRDAHGIAVYGTAEAPITDVVIAENEVHHLTLGTSESMVINGNVDGFVVEGNHVHDNDNIGIDVIGYEGKAPVRELDRARNGVVRNNLVHDIDGGDNPVYYERNAGGIYVDGGHDIVIEDNEIHHSNIGIEIASEAGSGDTSRVVVRNNDVHDNHIVGLAMGGYDEHRGRTEGCEVRGNRFTNNDTDEIGWGELVIQFDVRDNRIVDNTFVAGPTGRFLTNEWTENTGSELSGNRYVATSETTIWQWRTETFSDFKAYRSATGLDADSTFEPA